MPKHNAHLKNLKTNPFPELEDSLKKGIRSDFKNHIGPILDKTRIRVPNRIRNSIAKENQKK